MEEVDTTLERLSAFSLDARALEEVRSALFERIGAGLDRDGQEIKALPAYLGPPDPDTRGRALVLDLGGTNVRAAVVELEGGGRARIERGPISQRLPARDGKTAMSKSELFDFQATIARGLSAPNDLPIGYCFSYPSSSLPDRDATLIRWTKGIEIEGVEGHPVGAPLRESLARAGLRPGAVTVMNDTVASMLGGAYVHGREVSPSGFIGLIVGTGTNMSGFFPPAKVTKLRAWPGDRPIAVNLESGNFHPPHLTAIDEELDRTTDNPGHQRMEKAVSGHYLPYLFELLMPGLPGYSPKQGSKALVDYRDKSIDREPIAAAEALLSRSADLVSAGLAALIDHYDRALDVGIVAEGSLFWNDPKFAPRVSSALATMLGSTTRAKIFRVADANLIGAACAALQ